MPLLPGNYAGRVAGTLLLNFAAMVFLGVTGFLAWQADAWAQLWTLRGLGFILAGVILAGVLVGALPAALHRRMAVMLVTRNQGRMDERIAAIIRHTGTLILLTQFIIVYYLTNWGFTRWIATPSI